MTPYNDVTQRECTAVPIDVSCADDVMTEMRTNRRTLMFPRSYGPHTHAQTTLPTLHAFAYTHTREGEGGGSILDRLFFFFCAVHRRRVRHMNTDQFPVLPIIYFVSSKFIPSHALLVVSNYTNRRYDQNTDPYCGCPSVRAINSQCTRGSQTLNSLSHVQTARYVCVTSHSPVATVTTALRL